MNLLTLVEGFDSAALSDDALKPDSLAIALKRKPWRRSSARMAHSSHFCFWSLKSIAGSVWFALRCLIWRLWERTLTHLRDNYNSDVLFSGQF